MLHFDSYQAFEAYVQTMAELEADTNEIRNAYAELGISPDTDSLSSEEEARDYIHSFTFNPVCKIYEDRVPGFVSARSKEEAAIKLGMLEGEDEFDSLLDDPYLKSALNEYDAVHIGTRIFKFFEDGGLAIILEDDWGLFDGIKHLTSFDSVPSSAKLIATNTLKENWQSYYHFNTDGSIGAEKSYQVPGVVAQGTVLACDIPASSFQVTQLANGQVRVELPNSGYDIHEWTLPDGTILQGNPLMLNCSDLGGNSATLRLDVYTLAPWVPAGRIRRCTGWITVDCSCGEWRRREDQLIRTIQGQTWRIRAAIWVRQGEAGCSMNYLRRRFGLWLPANNQRVCTDIRGTFKRELADLSCQNVIANRTRCLGAGTFPTTISAVQPDIPRVFREPNMMNSGHVMTVQGVTWGFGITVPRLVLN